MLLFLVDILFLRRNCKANPNCFNCLGEKFWLGEIKGKKKIMLKFSSVVFYYFNNHHKWLLVNFDIEECEELVSSCQTCSR